MTKLRARRRMGANAVEFAMVLPLLATITMGLLDYGWYYARQTQLFGALTTAATTGTGYSPGVNENSGCYSCVQAVKTHARVALGELGVDLEQVELEPRMVRLYDACAIEMTVSIPHEPMIGFFPIAESFEFTVVANAEFVEECD